MKVCIYDMLMMRGGGGSWHIMTLWWYDGGVMRYCLMAQNVHIWDGFCKIHGWWLVVSNLRSDPAFSILGFLYFSGFSYFGDGWPIHSPVDDHGQSTMLQRARVCRRCLDSCLAYDIFFRPNF